MKKILITLMASAGLMLAGAAHAGIATMENLDTDGDFLAMADLSPYAGLNWSGNWYAGDTSIDGYANGARSGTHYLVNGFGADNMDIASDSSFNFAGAWFATPDGAAEKASWVNIKAYDAAGNLIGGTGNVAIGASYTWVGANFGPVARLDITRDAGWYVMDDFATTSPVPEPQAPLMLVAGLLAIACVKRKSSSGRLNRGLLRGVLATAIAGMASLAALPAQAANYSWNNVKIVAGGFVDGIIAHPGQQGLFYARTDIGGAYRYNAASATWIALNDWTTPANWHQMGIESIAIDPGNANMLYMVAGMYTQTWDGNAAVLVSSNQGASFSSYPLSFRTGGNNDGRNAGERLQVDPNLGSTLFYGTFNDAAQGSTNGLWKSSNSGQAWSKVNGFTALSSDGTGAGVAFVTFYKASGSKNAATPTLFAGVSTSGAAASGATLYKSVNGGSSWTALTGGPSGQMPTHGQIGPDGNLYITYANAIGPNGMTAGQVWKYSIGLNTWQNITPPNPNGYTFGYGGLAIDPQVSGSLVVMTMDRWWPGDTMFRSTNGGASWTDVGAAATRDASLSPWVKFGAANAGFGNWGQVVIDPFNSAHAFYGTGQTVWTTSNLTAANSGQATSWTIGANGIEETAGLALVSPTSGAPLISGLGDICGFVHTSLTVSPAAGMVSTPICSNGTGLDYAKAVPATMVRVGTGGAGVYGAVSTNGGSSWTPFASQAGSQQGDGTVAMSADGGTIVWAPKDVAPVYSTNNGSSWSATGLPVSQYWQLLSDTYNSQLLYAYEPSSGKFYSSSNKGVSWNQSASGLPLWGKVSTVFGFQGDIWLASSSGLYRSTSSGWSWSHVSTSVTAATSVGFGKAAAGTSYPALYLGGTINGATALYRSTDAGSSWLQINDSAHQWAGYNLVVGDPKTFGTVYVVPGSGRGIIYGTSAN